MIFQTDRCIICHGDLNPKIGWVQLFSKERNNHTCEECRNKLTEITGDTCQICGRSFEKGEYAFKKGEICYDCIRWEEDPDWHGYLLRNYSLFMYNDFLKEVIGTYKFRGDYVIAQAFSNYIQAKLKPLKYDQLVPIPLSAERIYERGFNQAEALIKEAGFPPTNLLARTHTEKQSKKSRSDRIHLQQVFSLLPDAIVTDQHILLIDDIYTTGSTLRHAAKVLKEAGAASVSSLTLARG